MKVDLPMPPSRCRRGWMLWYLWGLLGTALRLEGTTVESLDGAALPMAFWLSAPFWVLFAAWPFMWGWNRLRARRLWGEEALDVQGPDGTVVTVVRGRMPGERDAAPDLWVPLSALSSVLGEGAALPAGLGPALALPGIAEEGVLLSGLVRWRTASVESTPDGQGQHVRTPEEETLSDWVLALTTLLD